MYLRGIDGGMRTDETFMTVAFLYIAVATGQVYLKHSDMISPPPYPYLIQFLNKIVDSFDPCGRSDIRFKNLSPITIE